METLPNEILFDTLLYLDLNDISKVSQLSKRHRNIGSNERFWQIKYENRRIKFFENVPTSNNLLKYILDGLYLTPNNILPFLVKSGQLEWLKYPAICNIFCEGYSLIEAINNHGQIYFEYMLIDLITTSDTFSAKYYFLDVCDNNQYKARELVFADDDNSLEIGNIVKTFDQNDTYSLKTCTYGVEAENEFHYYIKVSTQVLDLFYHKLVKKPEIKLYVNEFLDSIGFENIK